MTSDSTETPEADPVADALLKDLHDVQREVRAQEQVAAVAMRRTAELRQDESAIVRIIKRRAPGLYESSTPEAQQSIDSLRFKGLEPEEIAVRLAMEQGGTVSPTQLARVLVVATDRYANERTAYGSAYSHLDRSTLFTKTGRGRFELLDEDFAEPEGEA